MDGKVGDDGDKSQQNRGLTYYQTQKTSMAAVDSDALYNQTNKEMSVSLKTEHAQTKKVPHIIGNINDEEGYEDDGFEETVAQVKAQGEDGDVDYENDAFDQEEEMGQEQQVA